MKTSPVVHFEMPTKDRSRVKRFYETVFGWKMKQLGNEMDNYLLASTTETDKNGMVKTPGNINGGFWKSQEKAYPHIVISIENIEKSIEKIKKSGGKILGGHLGPDTIDNIPGVGRYISIEDSEGNNVGILEPMQK